MRVNAEDSEEELPEQVPEEVRSLISRCYEKALADQKPIAEAFSLKNVPHVLYVDPAKFEG